MVNEIMKRFLFILGLIPSLAVSSCLSDLGKIYLYNEIGHHYHDVVKHVDSYVTQRIPDRIQYAPDFQEVYDSFEPENREDYPTYVNPFTGEVQRGQYLNQDPYAIRAK